MKEKCRKEYTYTGQLQDTDSQTGRRRHPAVSMQMRVQILAARPHKGTPLTN